jgi:hypothetical protein
MPSRLGILTIVVFWLVSTTWLIVREIAPLFQAGEPPAFLTDVTDEVGGTTITWKIMKKGTRVGEEISRVGDGISQVRRRPDRTFELASELRFQKWPILNTWGITKIAGYYRVDKDGNLKELETLVKIATPPSVTPAFTIKAGVKGTVQGGLFTPKVFLDGEEKHLGPFQPQPVPVASHGNVLNTMHLLNKIPGLRAGRSWKVPLLDPLGSILPGRKATTSILIAEVYADELEWQNQTVACFRIDYQEPGKKATAHTWVRRSDGLVLQQEANHDDMNLVLIREVAK